MVASHYPTPETFLKAKEKRLGEVFLSHNRQFIVPLNQRPWSWKDAGDVQHLLDDFDKTLTTFFDPTAESKWTRRPSVERPPHFFGTFVFYRKSEEDYEIFDGQQRLTAILMLCAVMREIANDVQSQKGKHQQDASNIYGGFNEWLLLSPSHSQPRLRPNTFFDGLFRALIFEPIDDKSRNEALAKLPDHVRQHSMARKLLKSFYHIRTWVLEKTDADSPMDRTTFLCASYDVLRYLFSCVETLIYDEQYSYEVFGCLNARGERLTGADNIKNDLFTNADRSTHNDISGLWHQIGENLPNQDIGEFLRRRHIALHGPCKKADTHQQIKQQEIQGAPIKPLVQNWCKDSSLVKRIVERDTGLAKKETLDRLEIIFAILDVGLAYIPLLAAAKKFFPKDKNEFHKCVRLVEKFVFRSLTIEQIDTAELERKLGEAARKLSQDDSVKKFEAYIQSQVDNTRFEDKFSRHTERRVKVQYYILRELETDMLGGGKGVIPGDHHSAKNHIEHVLPKRLSHAKGRTHEWSWARANPDKHKGLINRLGNLLILESDINKEVGNHEFVVKQNGKYKKKKSGKVSTKKSYQQSALKWPEELADSKKWSQWTEEEIEKRQSLMAKHALKVWAL